MDSAFFFSSRYAKLAKTAYSNSRQEVRYFYVSRLFEAKTGGELIVGISLGKTVPSSTQQLKYN